MTEIVIQADLGGLSIAFTENLSDSSTGATIDEHLDRLTKSIGRQRSRFTLAEKLVDLLAVKKSLAGHEERVQQKLRLKAEERVRINAAYARPEDGRRLERPKSKQQEAAEHQNDEEMAQIRKDSADEKEGLERQIPLIEAQISRLRAVIAGRDPTEALEEEREKLSVA